MYTYKHVFIHYMQICVCLHVYIHIYIYTVYICIFAHTHTPGMYMLCTATHMYTQYCRYVHIQAIKRTYMIHSYLHTCTNACMHAQRSFSFRYLGQDLWTRKPRSLLRWRSSRPQIFHSCCPATASSASPVPRSAPNEIVGWRALCLKDHIPS